VFHLQHKIPFLSLHIHPYTKRPAYLQQSHPIPSINPLYTNTAYVPYHTHTMASSPLRIAVLECDTPIGATKEKYGGYGNLFKELLNNGVKEVREKDNVEVPELDVRKYDVVNEETYPNIEDVDAVLLSGSRESSCMPFMEVMRRI
jgi:hypothetical protein